MKGSGSSRTDETKSGEMNRRPVSGRARFVGALAASFVTVAATAGNAQAADDPLTAAAKNACIHTALYQGPDAGVFLRAVKTRRFRKHRTKTSRAFDVRLADQTNYPGDTNQSCVPFESRPREFFIQAFQAAKGSRVFKPSSGVFNLKLSGGHMVGTKVFAARVTLKLNRSHVDYFKRKWFKRTPFSTGGFGLAKSGKRSTAAFVAITETVYILGRPPQSRTTYTRDLKY